MQAIATENNLSETAFFVANGEDYDLRWFTPNTEVDLCGHATLAAAALIFDRLDPGCSGIRFHTRSGLLSISRDADLLVMNFPAQPGDTVPGSDAVRVALGDTPSELYAGARDYMAVFDTQAQVIDLAPDTKALAGLDRKGMIVTAPGDGVDFVSRFFAPALGVAEDPVTGSAHCMLVPYWSRRLEKSALQARQLSTRGGEIFCVDRGDRVEIKGRAAFYLQGTIHI